MMNPWTCSVFLLNLLGCCLVAETPNLLWNITHHPIMDLNKIHSLFLLSLLVGCRSSTESGSLKKLILNSKVMTNRCVSFSSQNCHWNNDNFARRVDKSLWTNVLSGLTPILKTVRVHSLINTHKPLCFNVGPQGKKGLTTFLGSYNFSVWNVGSGNSSWC